MKSLLFFLLGTFIFCTNSIAQFSKNSDLGIFVGTAYYTGDINPTYHFENLSVSFGGIFRKNLDERYAIRGTLKYSKLSGDDAEFDNVFKSQRQQSFSTSVFDFAITGEFNFFPFGDIARKNRMTPYIALGVGMSYYLTPLDGYASLSVPFGLGCKFDVNERLNFAIEWLPTRTFTDDIEGFKDATFTGDDQIDQKQKYFASDDDWTYSVGVYMTFKIFGKQSSCAAYRAYSR